ncbi:MAG TPA: hypothetical protein VM695_16820 [Phycisphaerae bacterium]|nr:hypothetical protein [Phycisphaerae bacterium]
MGEGGERSASSGPVDVCLELPGGTFRAQIAVPEGPLCLAELVPIARELCDRVVEFVQAGLGRAGQDAPRGPGGSGCGRSMVPLSPPETFRLLEELQSLPALRRDRTFAAFRIAADRLRHAAARSMAEGAGPGNTPGRDAPPPEAERWYAELELECPFLAEGPCGQGVHRPLACRCRWALSALARQAAAPVRFVQALCRLTAELSGTEPRAILLPLAPLWASAQPALARRTWPARTLLRRLADILADESRRSASVPARRADAA